MAHDLCRKHTLGLIFVVQQLLKSYLLVLQIKTNTPVPDDLTEQNVPMGHSPAVPDISEVLRELPPLVPICK